jgi:hypothetical protein
MDTDVSPYHVLRMQLLSEREQRLALELRVAQEQLARERSELIGDMAEAYGLTIGDKVSTEPETFGRIIRALPPVD